MGNRKSDFGTHFLNENPTFGTSVSCSTPHAHQMLVRFGECRARAPAMFSLCTEYIVKHRRNLNFTACR